MVSELDAAIETLSSQRPFSNGQLKRLGEAYKNGKTPDLEIRTEIETWYEGLGRAVTVVVREAVERALGADGAILAIHGKAQRLKTNKTLVEKIERGTYDLSRMQDYMGVRFDLDCHHAEMIEIGEMVSEILDPVGVQVKIEKILQSPHNGYRAVHLHVTSSKAGRVEVQLRTLLQAAWANAYEKAGDVVGRKIRYNEDFIVRDPNMKQVVDNLLQISNNIFEMELTTEQTTRVNRETARNLFESLERRFEALPRNAEYYKKYSEAFHALGRMFESRSKQADSNLDLLKSLQKLENSLRSWRVEEQGK